MESEKTISILIVKYIAYALSESQNVYLVLKDFTSNPDQLFYC